MVGVPGRGVPHQLLGRAGLRGRGAGALRGRAVRRLLVAQAEALGGGPYGMEALNVLRIEKGFITHAEIHGRTTPSTSGWSGW